MSAPTFTVQRVNPLEDPKWDQDIARVAGASPFHSAAWARVLAETYGFRPVYFAARHDDGSPAALVPLMEVSSWLTGRRGISLPFTDGCAPLGDSPAALAQVINEISAHGAGRRWKHWELRDGTSSASAPPSVAFHGHRLALATDSARLFARFASATRRAVRRAEEAGMTISFGHDSGTLREFYALVVKTRRRHGLPPQPWRFFENIGRHLLGPGRGCVVLARFAGRAVAGALFLHLGQSALFKFGASDEAFQHLRPNNLVMWRAIEWHARAGFESLDFGRTSLGNEGLRRFKLGWGAVERRIEYLRFDCRKARFLTARDRSSGWHTALFKYLPGTLARVVGAVAYKHVA